MLLQGCAEQPAPQEPIREYAIDLQGGAKTCTVSKTVPEAGKSVQANLSMGNDGGWCALTVAADGKPYGAGLLTTRPQHGKVFIHTVGNDTRIDYTPDRGFTGADKFSVKLLPGDAGIDAAVTVSPGG